MRFILPPTLQIKTEGILKKMENNFLVFQLCYRHFGYYDY